MSQRTDRVDELLRQEIGALLAKEVADPRIGFATITKVETSPDLGHAKVWVSVIGGKADRDETLRALQQAMGYVRHELGRRLRIRRIPELHVRLDDSAETATRVMYVLNELEAGTDPLEIAPFEESLPDPGPPAAPRGRHRRPGGRGVPASAEAAAAATAGAPRQARDRPDERPSRRRAAAASRASAASPRRQAVIGQVRATATDDRPPSISTPWPRDAVPDEVVARLRAAREVLAVGHENPDADTLGATLAVCRLVEAIGGRATAVFSDAPPAAYAFMPDLDRIHADPDPGRRLRPARAVRLRDGRARRRRRRSGIPELFRDAAAGSSSTTTPRTTPGGRGTGSTRTPPRRARWSRCSRSGSACRSGPPTARWRPS